MASAKPPFAEQENLSAIYPVHNVRNLSGSDRFATPPTSPSRFAGPSLSPLKGGEGSWPPGSPDCPKRGEGDNRCDYSLLARGLNRGCARHIVARARMRNQS